MGLNLDLSQSEAKIARAREHFEALKAQILIALDERKPYSAQVTKIEKKSGWCSASFTTGDLSEYGLGTIVGDLIHNLRAALDYIVTALVDASNIALSDRHQFPIFDDCTAYQRVAGSATQANPVGPLAGITHGLQEIWDLQPFHRKPHPEYDVLSGIHRFSNADKHRALVAFIPVIGEQRGRWVYSAGRAITVTNIAARPDWEPNRKYEVSRIRFVPPYPRHYGYEANITVQVHFGTPAFGKHLFGLAVSENSFKAGCDYVAKVVKIFESL